VFGFQGCML